MYSFFMIFSARPLFEKCSLVSATRARLYPRRLTCTPFAFAPNRRGSVTGWLPYADVVSSAACRKLRTMQQDCRLPVRPEMHHRAAGRDSGVSLPLDGLTKRHRPLRFGRGLRGRSANMLRSAPCIPRPKLGDHIFVGSPPASKGRMSCEERKLDDVVTAAPRAPSCAG